MTEFCRAKVEYITEKHPANQTDSYGWRIVCDCGFTQENQLHWGENLLKEGYIEEDAAFTLVGEPNLTRVCTAPVCVCTPKPEARCPGNLPFHPDTLKVGVGLPITNPEIIPANSGNFET